MHTPQRDHIRNLQLHEKASYYRWQMAAAELDRATRYGPLADLAAAEQYECRAFAAWNAICTELDRLEGVA